MFTIKKTLQEFINDSVSHYGDKYDYSKVEYIDSKKPICIICHEKDKDGNEHGEFWQIPNFFLRTGGCPKCKELLKKEKRFHNFIEKSKKIHNNKYDYSQVEYNGLENKITIICPIHGPFQQKPHNHLRGFGCELCSRISTVNKQKLTKESFIRKARERHGYEYDYSKIEYINAKTPICIICPKHGEFLQTPNDHLNGHGCPVCANVLSKKENEIYEYCCNLVGKENIIQRDKKILAPQELDIYIPSKKIAIEYNGLYWHGENSGKDKFYHLDKTNKCKKQGIKLIHIFEDEFLFHKDIVLSKIAHILGLQNSLPKVMARKCEIKEIDKNTARLFLNNNHIQGFTSATIYLGAYFGPKLIGVMDFKKEDKNALKWELNRFASDNKMICQGIGGKLFNYFIKNYNPKEIKSFADRRWTINEENNIYIQLGFKFEKYLKPDYKYFKKEDSLIRQHKFGFRKQILHKKYGLPLTMTESEMVKKLGYDRIWDCGLIKYVWRNPN